MESSSLRAPESPILESISADITPGFTLQRWIFLNPSRESTHFIGFLADSNSLRLHRRTSCGPHPVQNVEVQFEASTGIVLITDEYRTVNELCEIAGAHIAATETVHNANSYARAATFLSDTLELIVRFRANPLQRTYPSQSNIRQIVDGLVDGVVGESESEEPAPQANLALLGAPQSTLAAAQPSTGSPQTAPASTQASPGSLQTAPSPIQTAQTFSQSGQLVRGFTLGTNQDPTLVSSLRLQLQGMLTDSVMLEAQLTDQNLPIQPEGTTLRLQELDRVYARITSPNALIEMGDVDLNVQNGEFTRIQRRIQGGAGSYSDGKYSFSGGVSVERGTYRSQRIEPKQGIRGPYKLTGAFNEPFILILPGTERVWLDGERLERGASDGFIIDYSLSEIRFLGGRFITPESRITVEFQYHTSEFTRSLFSSSGSATLFDGRAGIGVSFLRQADVNEAARTPYLEQAGDLELGSFVSGVDSVGAQYTDEFLLYTRIDTLVQGVQTTIYEHRPGDPNGVYRVRFSDVGEGNGSYVRGFENANGILYRWVGTGNGRFEPVVRAIAPKEHQLLGLKTTFKPLPSLSAEVEWGISNVDQNRFSPLDDQDNLDHGLVAKLRLDTLNTSLGVILAEYRTLYTGKRFRTFEPLREVEFDRIWGLSYPQTAQASQAAQTHPSNHPQLLHQSQQTAQAPPSGNAPKSPPSAKPANGTISSRAAILSPDPQETSDPLELGQTEWNHQGKLSITFSPTHHFSIRTERLDLETVKGTRANWNLDLSGENWPNLTYQGDFVDQNSQLTPLKYVWSTQNATLSKGFEVFGGTAEKTVSVATSPARKVLTLTPQADVRYETRRWQRTGNDAQGRNGALLDGSYEVYDLFPGAVLSTATLRISAGYGYRETYRSQNGLLEKEPGAQTSRLEFDWNPKKVALSTSNRIGYRSTDQQESFHIESDTRYGERGGLASGTLTYSLDTEQRPIRQEVYVFAGPELGTHYWEDLNEDGIPQLDEFFPEVIEGEGLYVLQLVPSTVEQPVTEFSLRWFNETELLSAAPSRQQTAEGAVWPDQGQAALRPQGSQASLRWVSSAFIRESSTAPDPMDIALLNPRSFQSSEHTLTGTASTLQQLIWQPSSRASRRASSDPATKPESSTQSFGIASRPSRWVLEGWIQSNLHQRGLGVESRNEWKTRVEGEWSRRKVSSPSSLFNPRMRFTHELLLENRKASNDRLPGRDFDILVMNLSNGLNVTWTRSFSTGLDLAIARKRDRTPVEEASLMMFKVRFDSRFHIKGGIRNQIMLEWRNSTLDGQSSPHGLFELTEGVGTGSRFLWTLNSTGRLNDTVQIGLRSSGRTLAGGMIRQTAEMTLRAIF